MLLVLKFIKVIFLMFFNVCLVLIKLFVILCGKLIWLVFLLIIIFELNFKWVKNIFIWVIVVFCVLFRMIKVLFNVWLCI